MSLHNDEDIIIRYDVYEKQGIADMIFLLCKC